MQHFFPDIQRDSTELISGTTMKYGIDSKAFNYKKLYVKLFIKIHIFSNVLFYIMRNAAYEPILYARNIMGNFRLLHIIIMIHALHFYQWKHFIVMCSELSQVSTLYFCSLTKMFSSM